MNHLTEQDAGLLEQAASMLEEHAEEQRTRGNCSAAEGAACSAHAIRRLAPAMLRAGHGCLAQIEEPAHPVADVREAFARRYSSDPADPMCAADVAIYTAAWHDARAGEAPDAVTPHITEPYTLAEIKAKIASHDYNAELLLQHAMLLLEPAGVAGPALEATTDGAAISALRLLVSQIDAGESADYRALQEHRSMRIARAALEAPAALAHCTAVVEQAEREAKGLKPFDAADFLKTPEECVAYLEEFADDPADLIRKGVWDVVRAVQRMVLGGLAAPALEAPAAPETAPWCPDVCPITGRPFFMWIDHWQTGKPVPTYGGPYDSYTIPVKDSDGSFECERYDHDEGGWLTEGAGWHCLGVKLVDDQSFVVAPTNPRYDEIEAFAAAAPQAPAAPWKDHLTARLVNDLRDCAVQYHGAGQLRERIAFIVAPLCAQLKDAQAAPAAPAVDASDTALLDAMERERIAVIPEFEGPWDAQIFGEDEAALACGSGTTPREAITEALASLEARKDHDAAQAKEGGA